MAMLARGKGLGVYILIIGLLFAFVVSVHTANAQDAPATGESDKIKTLNDDREVLHGGAAHYRYQG